MLFFDDYDKNNGRRRTIKKEDITYVLNTLQEMDKENKIKDLLIVARTNSEEKGDTDLPRNMLEYVSVNTKYEAVVFNRFTSDILYDAMERIAVKEYHDYIMNLCNKKEDNEKENIEE